jgi:hypothetical protein
VIEAEVWLQTDQFNVLADGHAVNARPPFTPQPVTAFGLVANAVSNAEVVARPVIVFVAAVVHVFAAIAVVGRVTVTLAITVGVPGMPNARTAADAVPEFVTVGVAPGDRGVTMPMLIVAAAPAVPVVPVVPGVPVAPAAP